MYALVEIGTEGAGVSWAVLVFPYSDLELNPNLRGEERTVKIFWSHSLMLQRLFFPPDLEQNKPAWVKP